MTRRRGPAVLFAALSGAALLAGCTGVPTSSTPQTVQQVNLGVQPTEQSIRPANGASQRDIVSGFLDANAIDPGKHTSARAFLTTAARSRWRDDQATIVSDERVGTVDTRTGKILVTGRAFGTLDKDGIFQLPPRGVANTRVSFEFRVVRDHGQYRISEVPSGLLITSDDFTQNYRQHSLYFFDNSDQYLVQDPRYTDIIDRNPLASWLLDRLAGGPREDLGDAVSSDTFPTQADPSRMSVEIDATTKVEIPGSAQLDSDGRRRLAAQLSQTLDDPTSGGDITITDSGRPVSIPSLGTSVFRPDEFSSVLGPPAPSPEVYFLSGGSVVNSAGKPIGGPLGRAAYPLVSVALSRPDPTGPLLAAGVEGTGAQSQLWVGSQSGGLKPVELRGISTRPAFAIGRHEVWVGAGTKIYRVTLSTTGAKTHVEQVPFNLPQTAQVQALRLSPDGSRLAVVLGDAEAQGGQLFTGVIVRGTDQLRVDTLNQISPPGVRIFDVAWLNPLRLFAVGSSSGTQDSYTYDTEVDGTDWTPRVVGLSSRPDSVTVTTGASAWVSAGGFVWEQSAGEWVSPTGGQTPGTAPIYLE